MQISLPSRRRASGFTLLEVLVSILVLVLGVIGMVGLQAASIQATRDSKQQSAAVRLAAEYGDMMRSNKDIAIAAGNPYLISNFTATTVAAVSPACVGTSACTPTQLAAAEKAAWLSRLIGELPGARVVVCFDGTPYDSEGRPQWACTDSGGVAVIKVGWSRLAVGRGASAPTSLIEGLDQAVRPSVVLPLIAGS